MEIFEINPHIRYCRKLPKPNSSRLVRTYDCRIFFLLSGTCTFKIEERAYPLRENTLLYIPSGVPYRFDYKSTAPIELLIMNFDFDREHQHLQSPLQTQTPKSFDESNWIRVPSGLSFSEPICIENLSSVHPLLSETEKEYNRGDFLGKELASALLRQCLLEILRGKDQKANSEEVLTQRLKQYLTRHYTEEVSAEALGIRFGYHPYHLNRIFKKQTGTTLRQYLIEQRIHAAKSLLLGTELTVGEIAVEIGIADPAYFSYCFKKYVGISPTDYRGQKDIHYL
ncbi:MAG: helix-turn-helix transcriptional regulator [Clostridia bacterium]|nr:helix-turn-helix transcriptional regulator [Clostridia bacterium]